MGLLNGKKCAGFEKGIAIMLIADCQNVCVQYGSFEACQNVSFSINSGDYVCIVGPNGSGKTTLVKSLLGLLPIKSGTIHLDRHCTGYLPQQHNIQRDFPATVREVVISGCTGGKSVFHSKSDRMNAEFQMKRLGLEKNASKPFSALSGGQQQRVLLARALCAAKNLLVLDEPVTGLDPEITEELYSIIRKLNREEHIAVLMVSHDIHRAVQNATHILHMNKTPVFFGTAHDYQNTPLYKTMTQIEVCETHFGNCGAECSASHIHIPGAYHHD